MLKSISLSLSVLFLAGCASVNSVSLTPIPQERAKPVRAEVSKTIFLAFNFNNDFVDPLTDLLKAQCPQGVVTGILTKDEVINYVIVHTRRVIATGYCVQKNMAAASTLSNETTSATKPRAKRP